MMLKKVFPLIPVLFLCCFFPSYGQNCRIKFRIEVKRLYSDATEELTGNKKEHVWKMETKVSGKGGFKDEECLSSNDCFYRKTKKRGWFNQDCKLRTGGFNINEFNNAWFRYRGQAWEEDRGNKCGYYSPEDASDWYNVGGHDDIMEKKSSGRIYFKDYAPFKWHWHTISSRKYKYRIRFKWKFPVVSPKVPKVNNKEAYKMKTRYCAGDLLHLNSGGLCKGFNKEARNGRYQWQVRYRKDINSSWNRWIGIGKTETAVKRYPFRNRRGVPSLANRKSIIGQARVRAAYPQNRHSSWQKSQAFRIFRNAPDQDVLNLVPHNTSCHDLSDGFVSFKNSNLPWNLYDAFTLAVIRQNVSEDEGELNDASNYNVIDYRRLKKNSTNQDGTTRIEGLRAGKYTLQILNGDDQCYTNIPFSISQPDPFNVGFYTRLRGKHHLSCHKSNDGRLAIYLIGGVKPYTVKIEGIDNKFNKSILISGDAYNYDSLPAGRYQVKAIDHNGCYPYQQNRTEEIVITEPDPLKPKVFDRKDISCYDGNDGRFRVYLPEGDYNFPFKLSVSGNKPVSIHNAGLSHHRLYDSLNTGTYTVTMENAYGCSPDSAITIPLKNPSRLSINKIEQNNIACYGQASGSLQVSGAGGTGLGTYRFRLRDHDNNVLSESSEDTAGFKGLKAGHYKVALTDSNSCRDSLGLSIQQPDSLQVRIHKQNVSCHNAGDGRITTSVNGGTAPYMYKWLHKETIISQDSVAYSLKSDEKYRLLVTDSNNCTRGFVKTVQGPKKPLTTTFSHKKTPTCYDSRDGQITLHTEGGYAPYEAYLKPVNSEEPGRNIPYYKKKATFKELSSGKYQVLIKDAGNCWIKQTDSIPGRAQLRARVNVQKPVRCHNGSSGALQIKASGGKAPYKYLLNTNGYQSQDLFTNLAAGTYPYQIRDSLGCVLHGTASLQQPGPIKVEVTDRKEPECGRFNGKIAVKASGGAGFGYKYQWSNGDPDSVMQNASGGIHYVYLRDGMGCRDTAFAGLSETEGPSIKDIHTREPTCYGEHNGSASIVMEDPAAIESYNWNGPVKRTGDTALKLPSGAYGVIAEDTAGCMAVTEFPVREPAPLEITTLKRTPSLCHEDCRGRIEVQASGGSSPYLFSWSDSVKGRAREELCGGRYALTVKDRKACKKETVFHLANPAPLKPGLPDSLMLCSGQTKTLSTMHPRAAHTWLLQNKRIIRSNNIAVSKGGLYSVVITNKNGCRGTDSVWVEFNEQKLNGNFLTATQNRAYDTLVLIDVSEPATDSIKWQTPGSIRTLEQKPHMLTALLPDTGTYSIKMTAHLGKCIANSKKTIRILDPSLFQQPWKSKRSTSLISAFNFWPNPCNQDHFDYELVLNDSSLVKIVLYNQYGQAIQQKTLKKGSFFKKHWDITGLNPGFYLLSVFTERDHRNYRLIIR